MRNSSQKLIAAAAAFLAFEGELMAGKILLPEFGGSAYVWCSTILFFQFILLFAYFGTGTLLRMPSRTRTCVWTLLGLSGFLILIFPLPHAGWVPKELQPILALAPFSGLSFVLFCTTPLLHQQQAQRSDYRIYAWSNAGAFAGLLSYPLIIEPFTGLSTQCWIWAMGGFLISVFVVSRTRHFSPILEVEKSNGFPWQWWILPALSSATLLATTNQLSFEASAGPLTWALPLAIFLATYAWAFGADRRAMIGILSIVGLIALTGMLVAGPRTPQMLGLLLLGAGAAMAVCHTGLAMTKSENTQTFYKTTALSSAIGSLVSIFLVPRLTTSPVEFPILTLGILGIAGFFWSSRLSRLFVSTFAVIAIGSTFVVSSSKGTGKLAQTRNLYGCLTVIQNPDSEICKLVNNNTIHGEENRTHPEKGLSYYTKDSGVAKAILNTQSTNNSVKIGVIGLGTGTLNHWIRPQDSILYYEINPQVELMARKFFSYLDPKTLVVTGDGRKCLEQESPQDFDILVLDAFSGDAIPIHLLTREAGQVYRRHIRTGGSVAIHITNAHVNLLRVVEGLAQTMEMSIETITTDRVDWVILKPGNPVKTADAIVWTDQRSSILHVLK